MGVRSFGGWYYIILFRMEWTSGIGHAKKMLPNLATASVAQGSLSED
jgi:hypothetical protein